ncbi:MAG TPA: trigger factor [Thermohalobaculum sp.]|nr:trigger factor [Thermohalobaculum sp.]
MQVTETKSEGLHREYAVTVGADALAAKTNEKLERVRADFQMKGFRKGKAPLPLLKKMFGKSLMGEVVQETVQETVQQHLEDTGHRPAQQPDVEVKNRTFDEGDDLTVEIRYDMLPDVPEVDFAGIALEKKVVEVDDAAVEEALERLAESSVDYEAEEGRAAAEGDQVVLDFVGKVDGEAFEGGSAEDYPLVIGSSSFIPGFEEQLTGAKAGEEKSVAVTFPENYGAEHLAGKEASFDCTVKEVRAPQKAGIDDALAQRYGAEDLDGLKGQIRERIEQEYEGATRTLLKRRLLDALDERVQFDLPPSLVEAEAQQIAHQLWHEEHPEVQGHDHEKVEPDDEHRKLAERRVRLGLLLAEVGQKEKVEISDQELGQAIMAQAQQYPGREREFFDFVRQNRGALEQIRAPLFEDKVVDLILGKAKVEEKPVSKDELQGEIEALDEEEAPAS